MKYNLFLFFVYILSAAINLKAQISNEFDSIKKKIQLSTYYDSAQVFQLGKRAIEIARKENSLSKEAEILQFYGNYYYFSQKQNEAKKWYLKSIELAKKDNNITLVNSNRIRLTFILIDEGEEEKAEVLFKEILAESEKRNDFRNQVECYNGLGLLYEGRGKLAEATKYYLDGIRLAEKNKQKYFEAMLLNNLGLIHFKTGEKELAKKEFEKALEVAEKEDEIRLALNLKVNLGLIYNDDEKEKALQHYYDALEYAKKIGFPKVLGVLYLNIANIFYQNTDYEQAIDLYDSAITIFKQNNIEEFLSKAYIVKARPYIQLNQYNAAIQLINEGTNIAQKNKNYEDLNLAYTLLSEIYYRKKDFKIAYDYLVKKYELEDSIQSLENAQKIAELQLKYNIEKKENELIKERSKITDLEKENLKKTSRIRIIVSTSIFIILLIATVLYIRHIRLTRKQQQNYSRQLIENLEAERSRIAKDLHDDIGQSLSIIKSKIHLFKQGQIDSIDDLEDSIGEIIEQTREISRRLYPSSIEKIGIIRAVASMLETVQRDTKLECSYEIDEEIEKIDLEKKTHLYRILQECVNNTIKHAEATALKIMIKKENNLFVITYQDNGKGISKQEFSTGMGFMSIRERSRIINGILTLDDKINKGFKLVIKF